MKTKTIAIPSDVESVLRQAEIAGNTLKLVGQLDRDLYVRTDKILRALGGKWDRKGKAHLFPCDARAAIGMPGCVASTDPFGDLSIALECGSLTVTDNQLFPTPPELAQRVIAAADIRPGHRVLEPSAGTGALAVPAQLAGAKVDCVEIVPDLCKFLLSKSFQVFGGDFLECDPPLVEDEQAHIEKGQQIWKPVVGFEDFYEVSSWGEIRRNFTSKRYKAGGLLAPPTRKDGYLNVILCKGEVRQQLLLHQIVAAAFLGPSPDGAQVNHKHPDGDKSRNWASNLEYLTSGSNNKDQRRKRPARYAQGAENPRTKLTADQLIEIKRRLALGESEPTIARDFNVTSGTINAIHNGKSWRNRLPLYDRIIANPPFADGQDLRHVTHALGFLKPGGRLVAIMSAGVTFRQDRATRAFRDLVEEHSGTIEDLPEDAFKTAGTGVRAVLVTIDA